MHVMRINVFHISGSASLPLIYAHIYTRQYYFIIHYSTLQITGTVTTVSYFLSHKLSLLAPQLRQYKHKQQYCNILRRQNENSNCKRLYKDTYVNCKYLPFKWFTFKKGCSNEGNGLNDNR